MALRVVFALSYYFKGFFSKFYETISAARGNLFGANKNDINNAVAF